MTDGFYSLVSLMPRHKIGIVALSNGDAYWDAPQANLVPNIISYSIYDQLLGLETHRLECADAICLYGNGTGDKKL